jgi:hypothetical protein
MKGLDIWGEHALARGLSLRLGNGVFRFQLHQGDCLWRVEREPEQEEPELAASAASIEEGAWQRWSAGGAITALWLRPALADLPVVIRPSFALVVAPQCEVKVVVGMPLWLQARCGATADAAPCCDTPILELSKTWFGDPTRGELAYQLRTRARRSPDDLLPLPCWRSFCPVTIVNRSRQPLPVERICLRCPHLELWRDQQGYCSGAVRATVREAGQGAEVEHLEGPPADRPGAERVALARSPARGFIHHLATGFGI